MRCAACGTEYQPGDRFCGTCGERIAEGAPAQAGSFTAAPTSQPPVVGIRADAAVGASVNSGPTASCPVCGSPLAANAARCEVCHFEPGASVLMPAKPPFAAAADQESPVAASAGPEATGAGLICPVHGPLNPTWTRCPHCLKEGREGRLPSGPLPARAPTEARAGAVPPAPAAPPAPPDLARAEVSLPPRPTPGTAAPAMPAPLTPPPNRSPQPTPPEEARPPFGVGPTVAVRPRSRIFAYLIEKEGETAGRVHQLDDDTTDIGRDPRNHITLADERVSGFHARVERAPDGGFLVSDRGSSNGTFLNDQPLVETRTLNENDHMRMGTTVLVLKVVR